MRLFNIIELSKNRISYVLIIDQYTRLSNIFSKLLLILGRFFFNIYTI